MGHVPGMDGSASGSEDELPTFLVALSGCGSDVGCAVRAGRVCGARAAAVGDAARPLQEHNLPHTLHLAPCSLPHTFDLEPCNALPRSDQARPVLPGPRAAATGKCKPTSKPSSSATLGGAAPPRSPASQRPASGPHAV
eukprot:3613096-Rhodomonas_salina.1